MLINLSNDMFVDPTKVTGVQGSGTTLGSRIHLPGGSVTVPSIEPKAAVEKINAALQEQQATNLSFSQKAR
jgi:hypothetical protein